MLIIYKCSSCKTKLGRQDSYEAIGEPYLICPSCGTTNIVSKTRNEWELKTFSQRLEMYLGVALTTLAIGGGGALGIHGAVVYARHLFLQSQLPRLIDVQAVTLISLVTTPICFWFFSRDLRKKIAGSRQRMRDPKYLVTLRKFGLSK